MCCKKIFCGSKFTFGIFEKDEMFVTSRNQVKIPKSKSVDRRPPVMPNQSFKSYRADTATNTQISSGGRRAKSINSETFRLKEIERSN